MGNIWKGEYLGGTAIIKVDADNKGFDIEIDDGCGRSVDHVTANVEKGIGELRKMGVYAISGWTGDTGRQFGKSAVEKPKMPDTVWDGDFHKVFDSCQKFQDDNGLNGLTEAEIMSAMGGRDPTPFIKSMGSRIRKVRYGGGYFYTFLHGRF